MIRSLDDLGDAYWSGTPEGREGLFQLLRARADLRAQLRGSFVRVARRLRSTGEAVWLRRAFAIVDLAERDADERDSIVTLLLLRHEAERAGIDAVAILDEMVRMASAGMRAVFANARDHSPADIAYTVRAFGELGARRLVIG